MYRYVFLDLDGTLTDPGMGITNSVMHALRHYGIEADRADLFRFIGPPLIDSFERFYGFSEERSREAVTFYREYFKDRGIFENEVYAGTEAMLSKLRKAGKKLVLATSKPEAFSVRILEHFGLSDYFDFVAAATMDEKRTRKDEVIRYALDMLNITDPETVIMVGDREHDVLGAKANHIASIGVLYGYGSLEELEHAGADHIASSPLEAADIILNK